MIILALPALSALAYAAVAAVLGGGPVVWWLTRELMQAAAVGSCAAAAATFRRGEHMWLAWSATGAGYAVAFCSNAVYGPDAPWALVSTPAALACDVAMNAGVVTGALLFVLAWSRAGLVLAGGRWVGAATVAAAVALAAALNGPALLAALRLVAAGPGALEGYDSAVSIVADVTAFGASVPLLRMAFALRGSPLAPVWMLLGGGNLSWVVYDRLFSPSPGWRLAAAQAFVVAATTAAACAAWAHRRAVRGAAAVGAHGS